MSGQTLSLYVHEFATCVFKNHGTVNADRVFSANLHGYQSVAHLQERGRERWHQNGDKVTNIEAGILITYARPHVTVVGDWRRTETGRTVEVRP